MKRTLMAPVALAGLAALLWLGCSGDGPTTPGAPDITRGGLAVALGPDLAAALAANRKYGPSLRALADVVGTGVGLGADGQPAVKVFTVRPGVADIPARLEGVPVAVEVTGLFVALSDPTTRARPAPAGFSVGHPAITAGTIGCRVKNASGGLFILSNNHVLANENNASLGDAALQPGPYDGGTDPADRVGTLSAFQTINFSGGANYIDAAIATCPTDCSNSTPTDDGYGIPSSTIFGDANGDGFFDNLGDLLGLNTQKYGRTTKRTTGQISEIAVSVDVCYEVVYIFGIPFCTKLAHFEDQIAVGNGSYSAGGDSGSLIVTNDSGKNPVGLLYAGSSTRTLANRIDLVLDHFDVTVDGSGTPPPPPPPPSTMHVGDLLGSSTSQGNRWTATVQILVHDDAHGSLSGATVTGHFSNGATGTRSCTTGVGGTCSVSRNRIRNNAASVTFTVDNVTHASRAYSPGDNHETSVVVARP